MIEKWLSERPFICGDHKTLADMQYCHEVDQTKFVKYDISEWPRMEKWLERMID